MRQFPVTLSISALVGAAAATAALMASCGLFARPTRVVVALDEAFAATRPGLAAKLQDGSLFGAGPGRLLRRTLVVPVALSEGAGKALDAAIAAAKSSGGTTVLVASPLVAKAIVAGGTWAGDPPLLVPEWHGEAGAATAGAATAARGLWAATSDPLPAYSEAGAAAGAFIAALSKGGGSPSCGILYSEAPSRPRAALSAFASAFEEASDGQPLKVRELTAESAGAPGSGAGAPGPAPGAAPGPATSSTKAAEDAVAELLSSDIRVLFVALGSASGAAIKAAARPGLAIGADVAASDAPAALAFRIVPNEEGIAERLAAEAKSIFLRSTDPDGREWSVPDLLIAGPAATRTRAARLDFTYFLAEAARRRP